VTLDVVTHAAAAGLDPGARGTIKVFNAVHQTIAADSVLTVTRLEPVACS
jgi:glucokinase